MAEVATQLEIPFIDLYKPGRDLAKAVDSITINGIHLNDKGYKAISEIMAKNLNFKFQEWKDEPDYTGLKRVIDHKNQQFFYKFRAVNAEYINGSRKEPWVQPAGGPISFPIEMLKLDQLVLSLDSIIWTGINSSSGIDTGKVRQLINDKKEIIVKKQQKAPL